MDLVTKLSRTRVGKFILAVVVMSFTAYNAQVFVRAILPLEKPWGMRFPWGMFKDPSIEDRIVVAVGETKDKTRIDIPLDEIFRYHRGSTSLSIPDHSRYLRKDRMAHRVVRKQFAIFLADWMRVHKGVEVEWVTLKQHRTNPLSNKDTWRHFGNLDVFNRNVATPWTDDDVRRWK